MSVEIEPLELGFHRPFTSEVSQTLKIKNPNHTPVAFKVKTTAPKQYCVRPNSGRIEPGKEVEVNVLLQAMKVEPLPDAKCKDKFQVQSIAVTPDKEFTNMSAMWTDEADQSSVRQQKIKVVFLPALASANATPLRNGVKTEDHVMSTPELAPPAYRAPSPEQATFTPQTRSINAAFPEPEPAEAPAKVPAGVPTGVPVASSGVIPTVTTAASAVTSAVPMSVEDLKSQLAQAQATIASLTQESGLRMRKAVAATSDEVSTQASALATATREATTEGVPVQIVAALCFISFLLAYLFF